MPWIISGPNDTSRGLAAAIAWAACVIAIVMLAIHQDAIHAAVHFIALLVLIIPTLLTTIYLLLRLRRSVKR